MKNAPEARQISIFVRIEATFFSAAILDSAILKFFFNILGLLPWHTILVQSLKTYL